MPAPTHKTRDRLKALPGLVIITLLAILVWFCICSHAGAIQDDINTRSAAALSEAGQTWVTLAVSGRHATLSGVAPTTRARASAIDAVIGVWGVADVDAEAIVVVVDGDAHVQSAPPSEPDQPKLRVLPNTTPSATYSTAPPVAAESRYSLRIAQGRGRKNELTILDGVVPSLRARDQMIGAAKSALGEQGVESNLVVRPGRYQLWQAAAVTALANLADVESPMLSASAVGVKFHGFVADQERRQEIEAAVRASLGAGVTADIQLATEQVPFATSRIPQTQVAAASGVVAPNQARSVSEPESSAPPQRAQLSGALADCQQRFDQLLAADKIVFTSNSAAIDAQSNALIDALVSVVAGCPDAQITINGHSDSAGDAGYNLSLSQRRALAVRDALIAKGASADRLSATGYGEAWPVADNGNADGRAENRRIEFIIIP